MLFLRLRHAAVEGGTSLVELTPGADVAHPPRRGVPAGPARRRPGAGAGAHRRRRRRGVPPGPPRGPGVARRGAGACPRLLARPRRRAAAGGGAGTAVAGRARGRGGRGGRRCWRRRCPAARFLPALRRGNVRGALDMGLAPGLLPGSGLARRRAGVVRRRVGVGAGGAGARGRAVWPRWPARAGWQRGLARPGAERRAGRHPGAALVALGADVAGDFPDRDLAERALAAGGLRGGRGRPPLGDRRPGRRGAAAAVAHERPGTTTNVEGRVSRLGQKLVPARPGLAGLDDRRRAGRRSSGADLGVASAAGLWDEIERLAPAYAGAHRRRCSSRRRPATGSSCRCDPGAAPATGLTRSTRWPCPGSSRSSARERRPGWAWPRPPGGRPGRARRRPAPTAPPVPPARPPTRPAPPPTLAQAAGAARPAPRPVPAVDSYSLRLVAVPAPLRRRQRRGRVAVARPAGARGGGPGQPVRPRPPGRWRPATGCACARPGAPWSCRPRPTARCPAGWWPSTSTCRRRAARGQRRRRS